MQKGPCIVDSTDETQTLMIWLIHLRDTDGSLLLAEPIVLAVAATAARVGRPVTALAVWRGVERPELAPSCDGDSRPHREASDLGRLVFDLACQLETFFEIGSLDQKPALTMTSPVGVCLPVHVLVPFRRVVRSHKHTERTYSLVQVEQWENRGLIGTLKLEVGPTPRQLYDHVAFADASGPPLLGSPSRASTQIRPDTSQVSAYSHVNQPFFFCPGFTQGQ